jgi:uncharacterized membrane protein YoaK (UPF0700 family)
LDGVLCRAIVCGSFVLSGLFCALFSFWARDLNKKPAEFVVISLLIVEVIVLAVSWIIGHHFNNQLDDSNNVDDAAVIIVASILAVAMGVQNVAAKEGIANVPPTTVMTSTLINTAITFAQAMCSRTILHCFHRGQSENEQLISMKKKSDSATEKFIVTVKPLVFFVIGAVVGAAFMHQSSFISLVIPIVIVSVITFSIYIKNIEHNQLKLSNPHNETNRQSKNDVLELSKTAVEPQKL